MKAFFLRTIGRNDKVWMEENNFPCDIIWLSRTGFIVHIEENLKCYVLSLELSSSSLEKNVQ
jgi:uncharacterized membrane protein (UPF0127 family)